jgi:hypothetical protein
MGGWKTIRDRPIYFVWHENAICSRIHRVSYQRLSIRQGRSLCSTRRDSLPQKCPVHFCLPPGRSGGRAGSDSAHSRLCPRTHSSAVRRHFV